MKTAIIVFVLSMIIADFKGCDHKPTPITKTTDSTRKIIRIDMTVTWSDEKATPHYDTIWSDDPRLKK